MSAKIAIGVLEPDFPAERVAGVPECKISLGAILP
jgi:hypothetical protein